MYLVVRNYKRISGNRQILSNMINSEFVPLISKVKGFVDYYCLYPNDSGLVTISVFQDAQGANESVKLAADWVEKNLSDYFPDKPEIIAGEAFNKRHEKRKAA